MGKQQPREQVVHLLIGPKNEFDGFPIAGGEHGDWWFEGFDEGFDPGNFEAQGLFFLLG